MCSAAHSTSRTLRRTRSCFPTQPRTTRPQHLTRAIEAFGESTDQFAFPRLTSAGWEAEQIAKLAPADQVFKALSFDANRQLATSGKLSEYRIVHFASHSFINAAHPDLSGIVLSLVDRSGQEQDGFLRLYEIYNLKLSADLVVLGGCRTGLGREVKGEGLISLTRGFMYAGAARVIVSAWEVQDQPSATLMVKFYRSLLGPKRLSAAAALRAAQREMIHRPSSGTIMCVRPSRTRLTTAHSQGTMLRGP